MPNVCMLNNEPVNHKSIYIQYELMKELREFFYTYSLL